MTGFGDLTVRVGVERRDFSLDVGFSVRAGTIAALVGPNGAGKTTCLAAISGLVRPRAGRVAAGETAWFDSGAGIDLPPHRRRVGLVPQDGALFGHRSVLENAAYGARARGAPRREAAAEAARWLDRLGLGPLAGRPVGSLSGGERQRVALARALASGARVLLLDEPFGSLDAVTRAAARGGIRDFLASVGLPALLVTHDPLDALALAGRLLVLEDGRITQEGAPEDLLTRPRTRFAAELLGLNLYSAELAPAGELRDARAGALTFHVLAGEHAGTVSLAFPPSAVALFTEPPHGSPRNTFPGVVREAIPLADRVRVILDCGAPLAAEVTRDAAGVLDLVPGRRVWASVKATEIRVYP